MIKAVRGTRDILPEEAARWEVLERAARRVFSRYGYHELRTPLFEKTELFSRAVGETTDIVEKEMYTFPDRNGESLTLRPEGTASAVRAFIENGLDRQLPWGVYYIGPMFRYERPQKGRYRQFHQIGCELFGPEGPLADAEMMAMVLRFLRQVGLESALTLEINSLGCDDCRPAYRERLTAHLLEQRERLCGHCNERLERNPLRVLDCKVEGCKNVAAGAPHMKDHLCGACQDHFGQLQGHLDRLGLAYRVNPLMVRGLDYYTRTAFEVTTTALGAQNAVAAGGRYDRLVAEMGGKPTPAVGFAMGVERLSLLLGEEHLPERGPQVFLVTVGEGAEGHGLAAAETLRQAGLRVAMGLMGGSMKSQMKKAGKSGAAVTLIVGEQEVAAGSVVIKAMATGGQESVPLAQVAERVAALL